MIEAARTDRAGMAERQALVAFLHRKSGNPVLAEDIAQDAMIRLIEFQRREKVRNPQALLFKIGLNLLINHLRRERRLVGGLDSDIAGNLADERPSQERAALDSDRMAQFQRALDTLPPLRREVLVRRRVEHQSYEEIGQALSLSASAVEKHVVRALASLRAYQDKNMIEGERPW